MVENHAVPSSSGEAFAVDIPSQSLPSLYIPGQATPALRTQAPPATGSNRDGWITGEPVLRDLLEDPLIHAVLQRDGLDRHDLLQAIYLGRRRLALARRLRLANDTA